MNPIDVVCLIFILLGVIFIIASVVHRHKGMWNLGGNDLNEPWNSVNPPRPHNTRRGIESPYDETQIGVELIILGLVCLIYNAFGLCVCAAAVIFISIASLVFNGVRLRRMNAEDELRTWSKVHIMASGFALFFGGLVILLT